MASFMCDLMSTRLLVLLPLFLAIATNCFSSMQPLCHDDDSSALLQFKESFDMNLNACRGPFAYPKIATWKQEGVDRDCCSWDGVECDEDTGHVIGLDLSSSCLYGSMVSNSLFRLVHLQRLNLAYNNFNFSQIPSGFSLLSRLTYLNLSYSSFSGQIPSNFSKLSKLSTLDLSKLPLLAQPESVVQSNLHLKSLKSLVQNLTSLKVLCLNFVQISSPVPEIFSNLSSLTTLQLKGCGLHGEFPVGIFKLPKLQELRVNRNQDLMGYFPEFHLSNPLKILSVGQTSFSGKLPASMANLTQLSFLEMTFTQLTGQIPSWLANMTQLTALFLSFNKLQGPLPNSIFELEKLETLHLYSNNLSGIVAMDMFHKLKYLTSLFLSMNHISFITKTNSNATQNKFKVLGLGSCNLSHFPDFLRNQNQLQWLDLSYNNIHGQIPIWVWNTSKETLKFVNFSHNYLTGFDQHQDNFPWPQLLVLDLSSNKIQESLRIPPPSMKIYSVANNMLQGEISPSICNLSSLYSLDLSNNQFSGILPHCLSNLSCSLNILNLRANKFHGMIPQLCAKGSTLKMIDLSQNQFEGVLPRSLSNCRMLEVLNLGSNELNDVFPSWLGTLPELRVLSLQQNGFYGVVGSPTSFFASPKLGIVDLSVNKFTGNLPFEYFQNWMLPRKVDAKNYTHMQASTFIWLGDLELFEYYLYSMKIILKGKETLYQKIREAFAFVDLSSNEFNGTIPEFIGNLNGFQLLNLSNNNLTGHIPISFGNMSTLESLDLSQNKLSGQIPMQLTQLTFLASFNVSHNQLTGPIPQSTQFNTFDSSSFGGNVGLCGNPLSKKCENPEPPPLPTASIEEDQGSWFHIEFDWKIILLGYCSGIINGVIVGNIVTKKKQHWFVRARKRQHKRERRQLC
uniref:Leucine-rich repeat-containing N-terminal plant-type domain-containing protein n=1 Tax=Fagus sylvatica TaxID=28930 RepID=A0A2N9I353_FAGSY